VHAAQARRQCQVLHHPECQVHEHGLAAAHAAVQVDALRGGTPLCLNPWLFRRKPSSLHIELGWSNCWGPAVRLCTLNPLSS
jgi:hypothetical protein